MDHDPEQNSLPEEDAPVEAQLPYNNPQLEDGQVDQLMDQEDQPTDHVDNATEEEEVDTIPLHEDESRHIDGIISSVITGAGQLRQHLYFYGKASKNKPAFKWRKKTASCQLKNKESQHYYHSSHPKR